MDLPALADFNLVAGHGGFGRASRASGRPKASLSRRVGELEDSLGVRLIERGARSLRLTDAGRILHARTTGLLRELAEIGETVGAGLEEPRGVLRVSAPVLYAHVALGRLAAGFIAAHTMVRLEITAEDRFVDLVEEGYDVLIRVNPAPDDRLVGRCILHDELLLVAHPGLVRPPWDSAPFRSVVLGASPPDGIWRVAHDGGVDKFVPDPVLRLSSLLMVRDAALAGAGAALLPRSLAGADIEAGRLALWGAAEGREVAVWALHASSRLVSAKVRAFVDWLASG